MFVIMRSPNCGCTVLIMINIIVIVQGSGVIIETKPNGKKKTDIDHQKETHQEGYRTPPPP